MDIKNVKENVENCKDIMICVRRATDKKIPKILRNGIEVYFRGVLEKDGDNFLSFEVNNEIMEKWGKDIANLITEVDKEFVLNELPKMLGLVPSDVDTNVYVLTNNSMVHGAGLIFLAEVQKKIFEKVGTYFVIPSSIHEVLIIPSEYSEERKKTFDEMVVSVNHDVVSEREQLHDEVWFFDGKELI